MPHPVRTLWLSSAAAALFVLAIVPLGAQDRLRTMPGFDQFTKMSQQLQGGAFVSGSVSVRWEDNGQAFTYTTAGQTYRFDLATLTASAVATPALTPSALPLRPIRSS